ncbi:unnamed protein product, partial [Didymodactylos carnosus]
LNIKKKYLGAVGTNIDTGHDVLQQDIDNRLKALKNSILLTWTWELQNEYVKQYYDIFQKCEPTHSIVHSLICSALEGHRGSYIPEHLNKRVTKSKVLLSDATKIAYLFDLDDVASQVIYLNKFKLSMKLDNIYDTIYGLR